ncbi:MAG: type III pantothenate kinase [Planctomycetota bacterium]|jgi:type III pantothenate kinase
MTSPPDGPRVVTILAGNSTLRWIVWADAHAESRGTADVEGLATGGLPAELHTALASGVEVALASVNPPVAAQVQAASAAAGAPCAVFGDALPNPLPISSDVTDPEGIGVDRLLGAYAAWRLHGGPIIVVDVGTAITVNAVNADGAFAGGAIAVGPHLAAQALASGTAQLPLAPDDVPERALGRNTAEALAAGVAIGLGGLVWALVERVREELRGRARCVATGGGLRRLRGYQDAVDGVHPDLVLIGLRLAAQEAAEPESA